MGVADEVLRENGEKKTKKRERESWNILEFGGNVGIKRGKK